MLVLKFTCDKNYKLNSKIISEKFADIIGNSDDIKIKEGNNSVKLYLGKESSKNVSLPIELTDDDLI